MLFKEVNIYLNHIHETKIWFLTYFIYKLHIKKILGSFWQKTQACSYILYTQLSLHKKLSFPLSISSVNVTNRQKTADLVPFTEEILNGKLHHFCAVYVPSNLVTWRQPSWEGITPRSPIYLKPTLWVAVQKSLMFLDKFNYWWLSLESVTKLCSIGSMRI